LKSIDGKLGAKTVEEDGDLPEDIETAEFDLIPPEMDSKSFRLSNSIQLNRDRRATLVGELCTLVKTR
jgi:hypothetical protein